MELHWRAVAEDRPGPLWAGLHAGYRAAYERWWLSEGELSRPTWLECRRAMRRHMPELVPIWEELSELAGGSDRTARFLSFWRPPPYLAGCSQAVWPGEEPVLVRNYDYSPYAFDALTLRTEWAGRAVMGTADGMIGLVDGVNDAGLSVSLTFGGRREVGEGFGVPIILRYVLQTCETAEEAGRTLARVPTHMSYNVTAIDARRRYVTAYLAPDREAVVTRAAVATNHQESVEWSSHARFTATVERERFLLQRLTLHVEPEERFVAAFLRPPLYSTRFGEGFGTLYTAVYRPRRRSLELLWPRGAWRQSLDAFEPGAQAVSLPSQVA